MKSLIYATLLLLIAVQCIKTDPTTVAPKKTCKDLLPEKVCDQIKKVISRLHESASTLQDAINAAVAKGKTSTKDLIQFIKVYIAEKMKCGEILTNDTCTLLKMVAKRLKMTKDQVAMAIEKSIALGKNSTKDIYENVIEILTGEIDCDHVLGDVACNNMKSAIAKFHEQRSLLKEAIMNVTLQKYLDMKNMATLVKNYIVSKVVNFTCEDYIGATNCARINKIAKRLKILPAQVKYAIETAIINGAGTVSGIVNGTLAILTKMIKCDTILTPKACTNLRETVKKLHEQTLLINQAIMEALLKQVNDAKDIYQEVRGKIIQAAKDFNCTTVLTADQCNRLKSIAKRFKLHAGIVKKTIIEAVVNGTATAIQLYQVTVGVLITAGKNLKCEDIIDPTVCAVLDNFAARLRVRKEMVTEAVKQAIVAGKKSIDDIRAFVKKIVVDDRSCYDFLKSRFLCKTLQTAAYIKGITFDRVIAKIRDIYASGVQSVRTIIEKVRNFIKGATSVKRSIAEEQDPLTNKDEIIDFMLQVFGGISTAASKFKDGIKNELKRLYDAGLLKFSNAKEVIKKVIAKYTGVGNDEVMDETSTKLESYLHKLKKEFKDNLKKMMAVLKSYLNKLPKDKLKEIEKQLKELGVMSDQEIDMQFDYALSSML